MSLSEGEYENFSIPEFTQENVRTLQSKISSNVWPNELENVHDWSYGAPSWAVKPLAEEWANKFDWEELRVELKQWNHYRMKLDDSMVHYIHERSSKPDAIPLVLVHGWPSTFYEFHKIINSLRDGEGNKQAFHVVVPSLPGYGFSEAPKKKGCGVIEMASILNRLMTSLGYDKYLYHGADWGAIIGRIVSVNHDQNCKALHTVMLPVPPVLPSIKNILFHPIVLTKSLLSLAFGLNAIYGTPTVQYPPSNYSDVRVNTGAGYSSIQSTKPYTVSYGLSDSPVGLLSWLLDKFHDWTYHSGDKEKNVLPETIDSKEFLSQVSIYWMTNSISSSVRIYYEAQNNPSTMTNLIAPTKIPIAVAAFRGEIVKVPREWVENAANLVQYREYDIGGHFSSLEEPKLVLADLQMFGKRIKNEIQSQ